MKGFAHRHPNLMVILLLVLTVWACSRAISSDGLQRLFAIGAVIFDAGWMVYWYDQTGDQP